MGLLSFLKYFFGSRITTYFYLFGVCKFKKIKMAFTLRSAFILQAPLNEFTLYPKTGTQHKYLLNEGMMISSQGFPQNFMFLSTQICRPVNKTAMQLERILKKKIYTFQSIVVMKCDLQKTRKITTGKLLLPLLEGRRRENH